MVQFVAWNGHFSELAAQPIPSMILTLARRNHLFLVANSRNNMTLIDSHHHLWKYSAEQYGWISEEMSVLRHDFLAAELRQVAAQSKVDGFVSVQAQQTVEETDALLAIAKSEPLIRGVVGWLPLADPDIGAAIDRYASETKLKGVRHVVQDEADDRFIMGDDFNRGVALLKNAGLVYDVLIFAKQLPASIEFADQHSELTLVLDHIAKPTIHTDKFDTTWEKGFREIAKRENLYCKFSGVLTEIRDQQWDIKTVRPYWDVALESFTPSRLMLGSDWPVCLLKASHTDWTNIVRELASELSADEQAAFFAGNAMEAYNLE